MKHTDLGIRFSINIPDCRFYNLFLDTVRFLSYSIFIDKNREVYSMKAVIDSFTEVENKKREEERYREYIIDHINNVKSSYELLFKPFIKDVMNSDSDFLSNYSNHEVIEACRLAKENIEYHDRSKYFEEEFDGYRYRYFPTYRERTDAKYEEKVKEIEDKAWTHHYTHNPHHPEYFGKERDMPLEYIIEMICDWQAMSIHFNSSMREWWKEHTDSKHKVMTDKTFNTVVELLDKLVVLDTVG